MSIEHFARDLGELRRDLEALGAQGPIVAARAVNRAATSGRAAMAQAIRADAGLSSQAVKDAIRIEKATKSRPKAVVEVAGRRIPLIAFQARGPEPSRGRGRGVSYRLPGGRGRVPDAFIATMRSGHRGVFKRRQGAKRLPVTELHGPSIPHVFEKRFAVFLDAADKALVKNLASEISFAQSKAQSEPE